ncbi:hypothetical protein SXCC_04143 [Gluconacetobacter sp. SXCC-1]|nr:hypothetical protein SXCC_04143 [Gluconacetobacter sp. SXCC-1]
MFPSAGNAFPCSATFNEFENFNRDHGPGFISDRNHYRHDDKHMTGIS